MEEQQFKHLQSEFNEMYNDILVRLRWNLDEKELGLQREQFVFKPTHKSNGKESPLMTNIAVEWGALELGVKQNEFMIKCSELNDCRSMKRIKFVMDLFDRYILNRYFCDSNNEKNNSHIHYTDIVMRCLSDYDGIAMLNDFEYIRDHKEGIDQQIECHNDVDGGECIGGMMRKCRGSERRESDQNNESDDISNEFKQFLDGLNLRERHLFETSIEITH